MYFTAGNILLVGSILLFVSIIVSKVSGRFGVPMLLLFLVVGMLFGSDGLGIQFSNVKQAQFIGMVALSIILFSGGMDTQFSEIKPVLKQGIALSTLGVILMTFITGIFIYLITKSGKFAFTGSLALCLLLSATMSSTDSASVFNILRTQKIGLRKHLRPLLELESGSNDPMAYMLTILLIQVCQTSDYNIWSILLNFVIQFAVGTLLGYLFGRLAVWVINKINLSNVSLYPIILLSVVFFTFSMTELARGNGYLAVYLAGIIVGNKPLVKKRECAKFIDGLAWLCQIVMFLTLGLLVNPLELWDIALLASLIGLFMIFVARPLSVFISLIPFKKPAFIPRVFASWVGLRGAVPIIFATYPVVANVPGAHVIFNIVFFITILSLLLQGTTITWVAKLLGMTRVLPKDGNDFGIELPEEIDSRLWDLTITQDMLVNGNQLKDMNVPSGVLVIMIKRGGDYLVPNGTLEIKPDDLLLLIAQSDSVQDHMLQK
ncbi:MAG: potassium/proton antiporter [Bacteroidales bacterium]|nr:potassium/proton antiporter [Bacteroidales bacterium]MDD4670205.1 potassium/proton antiporter [Bacteroidales bacterium]